MANVGRERVWEAGSQHFHHDGEVVLFFLGAHATNDCPLYKPVHRHYTVFARLVYKSPLKKSLFSVQKPV